MNREEMERLVTEIAQRVQVRLAGNGDLCTATAEQCQGTGFCARRRPHDVRTMIDLGAARVGTGRGIVTVPTDLARYIDHTLLKPDATKEDIKKLCEEAKRFHFKSVCVNSANVETAARLLKGSDVLVCAVVGFPLGASSSSVKAFETREAIRAGAREIDMVINVGALKEKNYALVFKDIAGVVKAANPHPVKVILETAMLTDDEKIAGCILAKAAGAAFVKTSTGFGPGGATAADVALMRKWVGDDVGVKASGGVRTTEDAIKMIEAGATRIGASASVAIVSGKGGGKGAKAAKGHSRFIPGAPCGPRGKY